MEAISGQVDVRRPTSIVEVGQGDREAFGLVGAHPAPVTTLVKAFQASVTNAWQSLAPGITRPGQTGVVSRLLRAFDSAQVTGVASTNPVNHDEMRITDERARFMVVNEDCYCEIDPDRVDRYGVPVLKFHWKWADHELNQALHMQRTFAEIVEEMGGKVLSTIQTDGARAISQGGQIIHEVGGACMGDDPKGSVLNEYCQSWDVPNLFVTDGAPFVSNADKNPILSIMALAWRASDYIVEQLRRRSIG